jgi:pyruvoyl-dependent arginine decarboxylase (PvlArgDC)
LSAADAYGDDDEDDSKIANKQGTVLEDMSFKTVEDASQLAEQIANIVRAKTLKRDNLLMAFIKAFNNVAVDTLKIDDLSGVKDHITTIYTNRKNAKQQAKASVSSGKATTAKKSVGKINMYDAYGSEEVSGRGASGGQLSKDADDYDFM